MITEYNGQKFEMMAPGPNNPGGIMNTMPGMGAPVAPAPAPAQAPAPAPAQAPAPAPAQAQAQAPPAGNTTGNCSIFISYIYFYR
jgi:hypothetical protein